MGKSVLRLEDRLGGLLQRTTKERLANRGGWSISWTLHSHPGRSRRGGDVDAESFANAPRAAASRSFRAVARLGAEQIIILGHHPDRIALAKAFGATDVVSERGEDARGTRTRIDRRLWRPVRPRMRRAPSKRCAPRLARPGGAVGPRRCSSLRGNPHLGGDVLQQHQRWRRPAPVRAYIKALLPDVLGGKIEPGRVFDRIIGLDEVPDSYRAMNERRAIKVMVKP